MLFLDADDILWWYFSNTWCQWGKWVQLTSQSVNSHKCFMAHCTSSHWRNDHSSFWNWLL